MQNLTGSPTAHSDRSDTRWNSPNVIQDAANIVTDQAQRIGNHAASTAKIIISTEEKVRRRVRAVLRVMVASIFFGISGLLTLGTTVTTAFAKRISPARGRIGLRVHPKIRARYHRIAHSSMRGIASWYGKGFNRRRTASGVRFNTHAMMAAHRTLPFGTKVLVTNLENHKSCIVEIMDRGPFARGRIIDLSYAAAKKIGMATAGIAPVKLEVLGATPPSILDDIAAHNDRPAFDHISFDRIPSDVVASVFAEDQIDH